MNQIARDTYDYDKFAIVSQLMWEAMENQRPAAWRVVFKGLTLLEHLVKNGSERVVDDARNHGPTLRALFKFNYYEGTVDRGQGVREKSKQIVEMLSDDERVREERMKARKLREKFGSKLGAASNSGGGGAGGRYSGYGNDGWSGGDTAGGSSYSEGGIGSSRTAGGRYGDERAGYGNGGGRYDEDTRGSNPAEPQPTFAAIPDSKPKKSKKKPQPEPAPEIDLFSFDDPAPAPAPGPSNHDSFGDFQSTGNSSAQGQSVPSDMFAAAPTNNDSFGAFASPAPQQSFDAFGQMNSSSTPVFAQNNNISQPRVATTSNNNDDDFGDFADAGRSSSKPSGPVDPLSKLISLDGLSKNTKQEDKLHQPVVSSAAAASYLQEKDKIQENLKQAQKSAASMGFEGLDGLHKGGGMSSMGMMQQPPVSMGMMNPGVMGAGGGGAKSLDMFDPSNMKQQVSNGQMMHGGGMQGGNMQQVGFNNNQVNQGNMGFGPPAQQPNLGMQGSMGFNMQQQQPNGGMQGGMGFNMQQPSGMQGGFSNMQQGQMNFNNFQGGMQGGNNSQGNMGFGGF